MARRKHLIAGQLAIHAAWHHASQQAADGNAEREAGAGSRAMLLQWGKLHNVRSLLGATTMLLFAWALAGAG
jgi:hypothetical protein